MNSINCKRVRTTPPFPLWVGQQIGGVLVPPVGIKAFLWAVAFDVDQFGNPSVPFVEASFPGYVLQNAALVSSSSEDYANDLLVQYAPVSFTMGVGAGQLIYGMRIKPAVGFISLADVPFPRPIAMANNGDLITFTPVIYLGGKGTAFALSATN